jgi:hypothetical protein
MPARCQTELDRCQGEELGIPRARPVSAGAVVWAASASRSLIRRRSLAALGGGPAGRPEFSWAGGTALPPKESPGEAPLPVVLTLTLSSKDVHARHHQTVLRHAMKP